MKFGAAGTMFPRETSAYTLALAARRRSHTNFRYVVRRGLLSAKSKRSIPVMTQASSEPTSHSWELWLQRSRTGEIGHSELRIVFAFRSTSPSVSQCLLLAD